MHEGLTAACAVHPDRRASITCRRCGSYACSDCTIDTLWGDTMCTGCEERGLAQYPIPWDREISVGSFIATAKAIIGNGDVVFRAFPTGSVARTWGFAASTYAVTSIISLATMGIGHRPPASDALPVAVGFALGGATMLTYLLVPAPVFQLAARMAGGHPDLKLTLRASAYVYAFTLLWVIASRLPMFIGVFVLLACVGLSLWAWVRFSQARVGLTRTRAVFVTCITWAVTIATAIVAQGVVLAIIGDDGL